MPQSIHGVLPILHTPFTEQDEIDYATLQREIDWAYSVGADGVCTGMVSEVLRLTEQERLTLNAKMAEFSARRGAVIASASAESTKGAVHYAKAAERAGCSAVMVIPPINSAFPERAIWDYFRAIADAVAIPVVVQDASSYVGHAIPISFYVRLLDHYSPEKILFKPEASPVGPNLSALRDASGGRARIYDGSGGMLLVDAYRRGITGTMPGTDLLDGIVRLWNALNLNDQAAIDRFSAPVCAIVALQLQAGLDGFLAIEKYILRKRGLFPNERRRAPFGWELDDETRSLVDLHLNQLLVAVGTGPTARASR
ncbi:MAG TPA: dihydrodipicolinate synthase family protein [Caulifigura sp.]|nr:dihydrodipicolinate synthase family protein [Caulifigura sp.]